MKPVRVFFFGDSICVGQHVALHRGWVCKMSAHLYELGKQIGQDVVVTNASANGRTTRQALENMGYEVQSQEPDILIVQFGLNDCNYWHSDRGLPRVSLESFEANLREIIRRALNFGCSRVFVNTNHPTGRDTEHLPFTTITYQQSNEEYNRIIRKVGRDYGDPVHLNDIEAAFLEQTGGKRDALFELLMPPPDLLHLSEPGHDVYFEEVYPAIKDAVLEVVERRRGNE